VEFAIRAFSLENSRRASTRDVRGATRSIDRSIDRSVDRSVGRSNAFFARRGPQSRAHVPVAAVDAAGCVARVAGRDGGVAERTPASTRAGGESGATAQAKGASPMRARRGRRGRRLLEDVLSGRPDGAERERELGAVDV
tara:strand:- start:2682 stop:3101 length:420 start_codon:yes stop_codon:yes gene_type:complete